MGCSSPDTPLAYGPMTPLGSHSGRATIIKQATVLMLAPKEVRPAAQKLYAWLNAIDARMRSSIVLNDHIGLIKNKLPAKLILSKKFESSSSSDSDDFPVVQRGGWRAMMPRPPSTDDDI